MDLIPSRPVFLSSVRPPSKPNFTIRCSSISPPPRKPESESKPKTIRLLQLSVTLTVLHSSLLAPHARAARVSDKRQRGLSLQEVKSWTQGLPEVLDRTPYTEIISLREEGKLKHIVKLPKSHLRTRPDPVLLVLEDSRVLKSVLPTIERDAQFWANWERLRLDGVCVNAYTPPLKNFSAPEPYLGWLAHLPMQFLKFVGPKKKSKQVLELERARAELAARRRTEIDRVREENEALEKRIKAQRKEEARRKKVMERRKELKESVKKAEMKSLTMSDTWKSLARDSNVAIVVGLFIFYIFYNVVVVNYRKQQKDYEDRLKIEKAEAEERRKMRQLEREMEGREGEEDDEEGEGKGGEKNPYLKVAMRFMRSGARIRRGNRRALQYLDKGVDVKFSDVAGLGNIRGELEEIVKFFTMEEIYRRRGVKIPSKLV